MAAALTSLAARSLLANWDFYVKLGAIAVAIVSLQKMRGYAFRDAPADVMAAIGVNGLANYCDPIPFTDGAGFSIKRSYPPGSALAGVVTSTGTAAGNGNRACCPADRGVRR